MEPYERILKTVRHEKPDRPAIDYVATPEAHSALKKHLGIDEDELLLRHLGVDIRKVAGKYAGPADFCGGTGISAVGKDFWGVVWEPKQNEFGTYNEISHYPLGHIKTVKEVEEYAWPKVDWFDFSSLKQDIEKLNRDKRYAIMFFVGGAFETPWYMRGLERFLLDLIEGPDIAEAICKNVRDFYLERTMRAMESCDGKIDIYYSGGDIGTQRGMMLSPGLWREKIKPHSAKLIRTFKDMGYITFYHSCGGLAPVIDDLIEIGLDVLDPIQPGAEGMEPRALKSRFGDRITFHGGIDVQSTLPFGKPQDVKKEVEEIIDVLGRNGGYIVCPSHAIQPDTPPENIIALYDTARGF